MFATLLLRFRETPRLEIDAALKSFVNLFWEELHSAAASKKTQDWDGQSPSVQPGTYGTALWSLAVLHARTLTNLELTSQPHIADIVADAWDSSRSRQTVHSASSSQQTPPPSLVAKRSGPADKLKSSVLTFDLLTSADFLELPDSVDALGSSIAERISKHASIFFKSNAVPLGVLLRQASFGNRGTIDSLSLNVASIQVCLIMCVCVCVCV